MTDALT